MVVSKSSSISVLCKGQCEIVQCIDSAFGWLHKAVDCCLRGWLRHREYDTSRILVQYADGQTTSLQRRWLYYNTKDAKTGQVCESGRYQSYSGRRSAHSFPTSRARELLISCPS